MLAEYFLRAQFHISRSSWQMLYLKYNKSINLFVQILRLLLLVSSFSSDDIAILLVFVFLSKLCILYHRTPYIFAVIDSMTNYLIHNHCAINNEWFIFSISSQSFSYRHRYVFRWGWYLSNCLW